MISSYANRLLIGGIALGIMIFLFPPLYGEGYDTLRAILGGEAQTLADSSFIYQVKSNEFYFLVFLLLISLFKVMAMAVTNGSGGVGGIFAPTLFSGGILGYIFAKVVNNLNLFTISESNFALVGMAGVMAGVMHAPLTAIFLIAEITGGYELFIPLILTSTISYLTIMYFEPHSIYTKRLAARGELITHDKDQTVLTLMNWKREIEKDFSIINPDNTLRQLVASISKSKRNVFPVIDNDEQLVGLVLMDNIREIIFQHEMYDTTFVGDLMVAPLTTIDIDDSLEIIFEKFKETDAWNLPVVEKNKYLGFISKSRIFSSYRNLLKEVT
jgi:CIC family chloride channel protein